MLEGLGVGSQILLQHHWAYNYLITLYHYATLQITYCLLKSLNRKISDIFLLRMVSWETVSSLGLGSAGAITDGVTPIFSEKTDHLFSHYRLTSISSASPLFILCGKTYDFFAHSLVLISLGCHPHGRCHPAPFLPIRPRLSTILCKFTHKMFFVRMPPLAGGCHAGRSALSPSDATTDRFGYLDRFV